MARTKGPLVGPRLVDLSRHRARSGAYDAGAMLTRLSRDIRTGKIARPEKAVLVTIGSDGKIAVHVAGTQDTLQTLGVLECGKLNLFGDTEG